MRHVLLLLLSVSSVVAAPAPFAKPERHDRRPDLEKMQGEWALASREIWDEIDSVDRYAPEAGGDRLAIQGGRMLWYFGREDILASEATIHLDRRNPGWIDFKCAGTGKVEAGVYKLAGDTFTFSMNYVTGRRPASLGGGRVGDVVIVLRRKR